MPDYAETPIRAPTNGHTPQRVIAQLTQAHHESRIHRHTAGGIALILGNRYRAGALIDDSSAHTMARLDLTGQPGTRLPHHRMRDGRSTLDLIETSCAVLVGPQGAVWQAAAEQLPVEYMNWTRIVPTPSASPPMAHYSCAPIRSLPDACRVC